MPTTNGSDRRGLRDRPIGEVTGALTRDLALLVRQELELAKAEMTEKGRVAAPGLGMIGGAGVVALMAAGALTACAVLVLSLFLPAWFSALLVGAALGALAYLLADARQGPGREGRVSDPGANHRDDRGGRGMGQSPSDIRAEIEETRARVGDEVDALSYKTDMPARVGDYVDEKKRALKGKVTGAKDAITDTASGAVPSGRQIGKLKDTAERNPLGLVVGGAAIGFLTGLILPSTRVEDRQMGEISDRVVDAAKETAGEALESGKQVAQDAVEQRQRAWPGAGLKPSRADARILGWRSRSRIEGRSGPKRNISVCFLRFSPGRAACRPSPATSSRPAR